ncbi:MAG: TetR/AcrR family transcriptional regulator [Bosea sp. (in: a-proteobacteria)]
MARKTTASTEARPIDPRRTAIEALMRLSATRGWDGIELGEIATEADMDLKQLRGLFPSKGAMLAGFARMIDDELLSQPADEMHDEPLRERLFDVMIRRLDALGPYRAGLARIVPAVKRNPAELAAMNGVALNSWRYMLASANIPTADALGLVRLQGTVLVFSRVLDVWLHDEDAGQAKTLAALDRELTLAGKIMGGVENLHKMTAPLRGLASALCRAGDRSTRRRERADGAGPDEAAA